MMSRPEECRRGVGDEMQAVQRGSRGSRSLCQLNQILVTAPVEYLGDEVLLAVEELVDRCRGVPRQVADPAQRAVPQPVFAKDPFCGVEDLGSVLGAAGGAPLAAYLRASRISHDAHHNHSTLIYGHRSIKVDECPHMPRPKRAARPKALKKA